MLGDLERWFATSLYPNRLPIAVGAGVLLVALAIVARRRGWAGAARRRPRASIAAVAIVLAVGLPTGWYLGSPLFIRTSLDEPGPVADLPSASPAPGATAPSEASAPSNPLASAAPTSTPDPTSALAAPRSGTFQGADDFHFGRGTASLIETSPGAWTVRFEGFSVRNGPDLYVYVSPSAAGYTDDAVELGTLRATDGNFNMDVPAGSDVSDAASIVIWCKEFAVQFAVATLEG